MNMVLIIIDTTIYIVRGLTGKHTRVSDILLTQSLSRVKNIPVHFFFYFM